MEESHKPKLKKCPYCNEKIAYMFYSGKKMAIERPCGSSVRWDEHTCNVDLPNKKYK